MSVSDFLRHNSLNRLLLFRKVLQNSPRFPQVFIITNVETGHYCRLQISP